MQKYFCEFFISFFCLVAVFFSAFPHSTNGIRCYECLPGIRERCTKEVDCQARYTKCAYAWDDKSSQIANGCSDETDKPCPTAGYFAITGPDGNAFVGNWGCVCHDDLCNPGDINNPNLPTEGDSNGKGGFTPKSNDTNTKTGNNTGGSHGSFLKANALNSALSLFLFSLIP